MRRGLDAERQRRSQGGSCRTTCYKPKILGSPEYRAGVSEQFSDTVVTNFNSLVIEHCGAERLLQMCSEMCSEIYSEIYSEIITRRPLTPRCITPGDASLTRRCITHSEICHSLGDESLVYCRGWPGAYSMVGPWLFSLIAGVSFTLLFLRWDSHPDVLGS